MQTSKKTSIKTKKRNIFFRLVFWLSLALAVFLALFVLVAKLFMQNLPYWENDILHYLQSKASFSIDYKNLQGKMSQIDAVLSLENLNLGKKNQSFAHIDKISVKTDIIRSLLNLNLVFDRLDIENLTLWVEEKESGWYFRGLDAPKKTLDSQNEQQGDPLLNAINYLEFIFIQGSLNVKNLKVYIKPLHKKESLLFSASMEYADIFGGKQLYSKVLSTENKNLGSLLVTKYNRLIGTYEGYEIFLDIPKINFSQLSETFNFLETFKDYNLEKVNLFGNIVEDKISFEVRSENLRANPLKDISIFSHKQAISGKIEDEFLNISYLLKDTKITDASKNQINFVNLSGKIKDDLQTTQINFSPIDLQVFKDKWDHKLFEKIPELKTLQPEGIISALEINLDATEAIKIKVLLEKATVQAWSGAPALKNLTAWVSATPDFGRVIFRQNNLEAGFPDLFNTNFNLDAAQGLVDWHLFNKDQNSIAKNSLIVSGRNILFEKDSAKIYGNFNLLLPGDDLEASYFDLNLGLSDVPYYFIDTFLPEKIMDKGLIDWIKNATKGGTVTNATLWIADSYVNKGSQKVDLSFDVKDATLKFLPEWQEISNLSGILSVENGIVSASLKSGTILGAELEKGQLTTYQKPNGTWLKINAKAQSKASIMQILFKQTPVGKIIPKAINHWRAGGTVRADLELDFPLTSKTAKPHIGFFARLINSKINTVKPNLLFENVNGTFEFDSDKGFFSKGLSATLWDMPISAMGRKRNLFDIKASVSPYKVFKWLNFDTKKIITGVSDAKGTLNLDTAKLILQSELKGINLNLPKPFAKSDQKLESFLFDLDLKKSLLKINYSDKLRLGIKLDASPKYGIVNVAEKKVEEILMPPQGLFLSLKTDTIFIDDWLAWWKNLKYSTKDIFGTQNPLNKADSDFSWQVKLDTNNLIFKNKNYKDLSAIARNLPALEVAFANPYVKGNFILNQNSFIDRLGSLSFKYVKLPENFEFESLDSNKSTKVEKNKSSTLNLNSKKFKTPNKNWFLAKFKPLDLEIEELRLGNSFYGKLGANIAPNSKGLDIDNINWQLEETQVKGYLNWQHIPYDRTKLEVEINGGDLSKSIEFITLAKAPIKTGEHSGILRLSWIGVPYKIELKNLRGNLDFKLQKGEFPKIDLGLLKGITRIFSLFNIDTLIRRLSLDFSDVTSSGLSFNLVQGSAVISEGVISTVTPIEINSTATSFSLEGEVDLVKNFINQELVVVLPVSQTLPLVALLAGASQVGIAIWATQKLFGNLLDSFTKARYKVYGDLNNPDIRLMKVF